MAKKKSVKKSKIIKSKTSSRKIENGGSHDVLLRFVGLLLLGAIIFVVFFIGNFFIGHVSLNIDSTYEAGESIEGILKLNLEAEEFIPADSIVNVSLGNFSKAILLRDLVADELSQNDFFINGLSLNGTGDGYGLKSEIIYPELDVVLNIILVNDSEEISTESVKISSGSSYIIEAKDVEIISVSYDGEELNNSELVVELGNGTIEVSTEYSVLEIELTQMKINLSEFGVVVQESGEFIIIVSYNDEEIITASQIISVMQSSEEPGVSIVSEGDIGIQAVVNEIRFVSPTPEDDAKLRNENYVLINTTIKGTEILNVSLKLDEEVIAYCNATGNVSTCSYVSNVSSSEMVYDDGWIFLVNVSDISNGDHSYVVEVVDEDEITGDSSTEIRDFNFVVDYVKPVVNFVSPTPADLAVLNEVSVIINTTIMDDYLENVTVDWNGSVSVFVPGISYLDAGFMDNGNGSWNFYIEKTNLDGNYSYSITATDTCSNATMISRKVFSDSRAPIIKSVSIQNNSYFNDTEIILNYNVTETNLKSVSVTLYDESLSIEGSVLSGSQGSVTFLNIAANTIYYYEVFVEDDGLLNTTSELYRFTVDTLAPVVSLGSGMPTPGSLGEENVFFNWTVADNMNGDIFCYPTFEGSVMDDDSLIVVSDGLGEATVRVSGGERNLSVICSDGINFGQSEKIRYDVSEINTTSISSRIIRAGDSLNIVVDEIFGEGFVDNVSLSISNDTQVLKSVYNYSYSEIGDYGKYSFITDSFNESEPMHIYVKATGFNSVDGANKNVTDTEHFVFLRDIGNTLAPELNVYPSVTYPEVNDEITIFSIADLDTLFEEDVLTITDPVGTSSNITKTSDSVLDSSGYVSNLSYDFTPVTAGLYTITASIKDYEGQLVNATSSFYVNDAVGNVNIDSTNNVTLYDINSGIELFSGDFSRGVLVPSVSAYDISMISTNFVGVNVKLENVNLTNALNKDLKITFLTNESLAGDSERVVELFDLESDLDYESYSVTFNYSAIAHTLSDENTLKLYKCDNSSNCVFSVIESSIEGLVLATASLPNMSRFMLVETPEVIVQEIIVSSSGGSSSSSSGTTKYIDLNLITPGEADMEKSDKIVVPIELKNPLGSVTLKTISLSAASENDNLEVSFDKTTIDSLSPSSSTKVNMIISSGENMDYGRYRIEIKAKVGSPALEETAVMFVRVVDGLGVDFVVERIVMVEDLFKENPQCLEFNDYLIEAEKIIDTDVDKARDLVSRAIEECRDIITSKEQFVSDGIIEEKKGFEYFTNPIFITLAGVIAALIIVMWIMRSKKGFSLGVKKRVKAKSGKRASKKSSAKKSSGIFSRK